jgi:hypothetical protein
MIHTVPIDDSSTTGKKLLHDLQKEGEVGCFEKPLKVEILNGYMEGPEFRASVKQGLVNKLKANGCL